jgi:hypothetical protein
LRFYALTAVGAFFIFLCPKGRKENKMNQELYDQMLNAGLVMLYRENCKKELLKINGQVKAKESLLEEKKRRINENPFKNRKGLSAHRKGP